MPYTFKIFSVVIIMSLMPAQAFAGPVIIKDFKRSKSAWFYNKLRATIDSTSSDMYNCTAFGHYMFTMSPYSDGDPYSEHGGVLGSLIGGALSSGPIRGSTDDCMMSLGYRRFNTKDATFKDFQNRYDKLSEVEKNKYHGDINPPEGILTRQWVNTFWLYNESEGNPSIEERSYMPVRFDRAKSEKLQSTRPYLLDNPSLILPDVAKEMKKLPVETRSDETAIIVVKIKPVSDKPAHVRFSRVDPETGEPDPIIDEKSKTELPEIVLSHKDDKIGDFTIYEVPSGYYALNGANYHAMCMRTVVFEAKTGEIVYLGEYEGAKNDENVHPLAPTPRMRFRFDDGDTADVTQALNLETSSVSARFKNNFELQCPAILAEKMYGVSFPGRPDF